MASVGYRLHRLCLDQEGGSEAETKTDSRIYRVVMQEATTSPALAVWYITPA
jgi:hypothetical protein